MLENIDENTSDPALGFCAYQFITDSIKGIHNVFVIFRSGQFELNDSVYLLSLPREEIGKRSLHGKPSKSFLVLGIRLGLTSFKIDVFHVGLWFLSLTPEDARHTEMTRRSQELLRIEECLTEV